MKPRLPLALSALVLLGLSACDRSQPAPEPEPYNEPAAEEAAPDPEPAPPPEPARAETANSADIVADVPPPPEPTPPDEQMLEDAEATGMTARIARSGDAEPAETDSARNEAER